MADSKRTPTTRRRESSSSRRSGEKAKGPLIGLAVLVAGLGSWVLLGGTSTSGHHPDPRPDIAGVDVVPASRYAGYPRIQETYREAAQAAPVLDGIYCYCECARHSGHRSLLTCFESDHAAACDVCLSEGAIAYKMMKEGRSLAEIRAAIDGLYGA